MRAAKGAGKGQLNRVRNHCDAYKIGAAPLFCRAHTSLRSIAILHQNARHYKISPLKAVTAQDTGHQNHISNVYSRLLTNRPHHSDSPNTLQQQEQIIISNTVQASPRPGGGGGGGIRFVHQQSHAGLHVYDQSRRVDVHQTLNHMQQVDNPQQAGHGCLYLEGLRLAQTQ